MSEFFCYDNTWRMVLRRLASGSDAVLMDLRGFSPWNAGCKFEIQELFNLIPLARVVFVVDSTTDGAYLEQVLEEGRTQMRPEAPNQRGRGGRIRFVRAKRIETAEILELLDSVGRAAATELASL